VKVEVTARPPYIRPLRRRELPANTVALARYLIGKTLVHDTSAGRMSGRIVETEAYPPGDAAGHAFRGHTRSNRSLFLERGHAYVYFTYGSSYLLNVTSEARGVGGGVLLRALEPLEGMSLMATERQRTARPVDLTKGPGRLAAAIHIDRRYDGVDLCGRGPLWLGAPPRPTGPIGRSVRIGISREVQRKIRFYERGNPYVSGPGYLNR